MDSGFFHCEMGDVGPVAYFPELAYLSDLT